MNWKQVISFARIFVIDFGIVMRDRHGEFKMPDSIGQKRKTETRIGGTTYIVNSEFNPKSGRTVLDKISRLIDKEISLTPKN
jgi:hypothetical protein